MSTNETALFNSALELPPERRAELAQLLIESLPVGDTVQIDEAWRREIERRLEEYDAGRIGSIPAEEVFARYQ
jgi:putative addiction module component (TIGR02574 family)